MNKSRDAQTERAGLPDEWQWGVFTVGDIVKILGISRRKILLYAEQEIIEPSVRAEGKGKANRYSIVDILFIAVINHLEQFGIAPRYLRDFGKRLTTTGIGQFSIWFASDQAKRYKERGGPSDPIKSSEEIAHLMRDVDIWNVFRIHEDENGERSIRLAEETKGRKREDSNSTKAMKFLEAEPISVVVNLGVIAHRVYQQIRSFVGSEG